MLLHSECVKKVLVHAIEVILVGIHYHFDDGGAEIPVPVPVPVPDTKFETEVEFSVAFEGDMYDSVMES